MEKKKQGEKRGGVVGGCARGGGVTRQNGVEPKDLFYVSCFILHIPQVEAHGKHVLLQRTSEPDRFLRWRESTKEREGGGARGSWCWGVGGVVPDWTRRTRTMGPKIIRN